MPENIDTPTGAPDDREYLEAEGSGNRFERPRSAAPIH
jgi:hypothetical protein